MIVAHMAQPLVWTDTAPVPSQRGDGVSLEVYDRRIPIYQVTLDFIRLNTRGDELDIQALFKFAADTDEAFFCSTRRSQPTLMNSIVRPTGFAIRL
jgi:hypothetical protein